MNKINIKTLNYLIFLADILKKLKINLWNKKS